MNNITIDKKSGADVLAGAWSGIQKAKPGIRIREAAQELDSSEASLLATKIGDGVTRLKGPWSELLKSFTALGRVMSLTRNDACILEHKGIFEEVNVFGEGDRMMATVIGPIETRVFFKSWFAAFAVIEEREDRTLKSIQIFDHAGEAVTKVYLQDKRNESAFLKIVNDFRSDDQGREQSFTPYIPEAFDENVDAPALLADWSTMKDTHDFFGMLRKHRVDRYRALELAAGKFTYRADAAIAPKMILDEASLSKLPIMIFAGNRGNLQIHQGKVRTIRVLDRGHTGAERWLNVLDPDFNMHMKQNDVHAAWAVRKPTNDGIVTSVELFSADKKLIAQFFGLRKPGQPEAEAWRKLVDKLPAL